MKKKYFKFSSKGKKGSDKMLSMYWFAIILVIALGIFAMVYLFYSAPYEVRDFETEILAQKMSNCFSRQGIINPGIFSGSERGFNPEFNLLEECNLIFEVEDEYDWRTEEQIFSEVEIYTLDNLDTPKVAYQEGNLNWKTNCFITDKKDENYEKLIKCREERIYALDRDSNQYLINILVGIAKIEKNARAS